MYRYEENSQRERRTFRASKSNRRETVSLIFRFCGAATVKHIIIIIPSDNNNNVRTCCSYVCIKLLSRKPKAITVYNVISTNHDTKPKHVIV